MNSYGYLYLDCERTESKDIVDQIGKEFNIGNQDSLTFDAAYRQATVIFRALMGREPTEEEKEKLYSPAKERFRVLSTKIKVEQKGRLMKYSHPMFSMESITEIAKQISLSNPETHVCSVAGFDHSAFILQIFINGQLETAHQIGDELEDMGLSSMNGEIIPISSFFQVTEDTVSAFLSITDVMDAEEFFFKSLVKR